MTSAAMTSYVACPTGGGPEDRDGGMRKELRQQRDQQLRAWGRRGHVPTRHGICLPLEARSPPALAIASRTKSQLPELDRRGD